MDTASLYKAFISYGHADDRLAPALQRGLETLGKSWYRRSALKIFRDETSLAANPGLWSSIEQNLARSAFFVLVASTDAARSPWVEREAAWWRAHRSMERVLIAVANGAIVWDAQTGDFDWTRTTCLPAALARAFAEEPLYVDLRWVEPGERLTLQNPRFRAAILTLAAPIHGKSKDELDSEAIRQQRRLVIAAAVAAAAVLAFALAAGYGLHNAQQQAALTQQQTELTHQQAALADSRQLAAAALARLDAGQSVDGAIVLAILAWRVAPTDEARNALVRIQAQTADVARMLARHTAEIQRLAFSSDSAQLASADSEGTVVLWRTKDWTQAGEVLPGPGQDYFQGRLHSLDGMVFDDDGRTLLTLEGTYDEESHRTIQRLAVWDVAAHAAQVLPDNILGQKARIEHVSLSPDGRLIAVSTSDDKIVVWDVRARRLSASPIMVDGVYMLRFIGPTKLALVEVSQAFDASRGLHVGIWDAKTARLTIGPAAKDPVGPSIDSSDRADIEALISSDGSTVALSKIKGGSVLLKVAPDLGLSLLPASQDLPEGRIGDDLPHGRFGSIDRAGKRLTYETDVGVSVWDLSPVRRVANLVSHGSQPYSGSQLSPDGRWLVSIVEERAVIVRDLERAPSGTATPALDASCSLKQEECIRRLCAKVAASIDEKLLNDLLYSSNLQDMKDRLSATCSAKGG